MIESTFPYKLDHTKHLTNEDLNDGYGYRGMFFKEKADAIEDHHKKGGRIYKLKDYKPNQFYYNSKEEKFILSEDATPYIKGWLVVYN